LWGNLRRDGKFRNFNTNLEDNDCLTSVEVDKNQMGYVRFIIFTVEISTSFKETSHKENDGRLTLHRHLKQVDRRRCFRAEFLMLAT